MTSSPHADSRNLMPFDRALNFDWGNDKRFFSLQVIADRVVGKAFGGNAMVVIKPSAFVGSDRPGLSSKAWPAANSPA